MEPNSRKKSMRLGESIAQIYDIYFPHDRDYQGGTDADHVLIIPDGDLFSGPSPLQPTAPGDVVTDENLSERQALANFHIA
jgi:hypothetical protein